MERRTTLQRVARPRTARGLRLASRAATLAVAAAIAILLLAACAPAAKPIPEPDPSLPPTGVASLSERDLGPNAASEDAALRPRPADAPDAVVLGFSGHCGVFCGPDKTYAYLGAETELTGGVDILSWVRRAMEARGLTVRSRSFSSHIDTHWSVLSHRSEPGYLDAQRYLDFVKANWIDGVENPTRVVLVGHSHGTVWANLLALNNLDLTFDYMVSLDAICYRWWILHKDPIYERLGSDLPYPLANGDPCQFFRVPGVRGKRDINDVVPANVVVGLEVRAHFSLVPWAANLLRDDTPDVRINGSRLNLFGIEAGTVHSNVDQYEPAMEWVAAAIASIGPVDQGAFPMSRFVAPPAPEGFAYRLP